MVKHIGLALLLSLSVGASCWAFVPAKAQADSFTCHDVLRDIARDVHRIANALEKMERKQK